MTRALLAILTLTAVASAQPKKPTPAEASFDRGRALMDKGDFVAACVEFERSLVLEFQFGTLYNIADCDEKIGKLASALKAYRKIAHDDFNQTRRASAAELMEKLVPRVPTVSITLATKRPDVHVHLDAELVDDALGTPIPIDLGPHKIVASVPQHDIEKQIDAKASEALEIVMQVEPAPPPPPPQPPPPVAEDTANHRRRPGMILTASGGAIAIAGLVFGAVALRDWHHAETDAMNDPAIGNSEIDHVRALGNLSTGLVITGVVVAGVGVYLWRSDNGTATISPHVGTDGGGVSVSGSF